MTGKEIVKIALNLAVIYLVGGLLLAGVYAWTSPIIFQKNKIEKEAALKMMMPTVGIKMKVRAKAADKVAASIPEDIEQKRTEGEKGAYELSIVVENRAAIKSFIKKLKKAGAKKIKPFPLDIYRSEKTGDWEPQHKHAEYYTAYEGDEIVGYIVETYGKGYSSYIQVLVFTTMDLIVRKIDILHHAETPGLGDEILAEGFLSQYEGKTLEKLVLVKGDTEDKIQAISGATISSRAVTNGVRDGVKMLTEKFTEGAEKSDGEADKLATH